MISAETIRAALRCGVPGCKCGTSKTDVHCPAHNSDKANFSVSEKNGKILVHCQAGCFQAQVIEALKARNLWPANNGGPPKFKIIKAYDYVDAAGKMVFQSCRLDPKDFRQRRPDGSGGWIWKMAGVKLVPYRLPELLNAETIYIVEGEKDCDNLAALGLVATTNVGGAGKWRDAYNTHFQGKVVAIIPDNDSPGRAHAQEVAQHLQGVASVVRILELPSLPEKGDVSDWLKAGGTVEQLKERANAATDWEPQEQAPEPEPGVQGDPAKISWIGHNYFVGNGRLCLEQFDRKGLPRTSALANFQASITEEITRDDGLRAVKEFTVEASLDTGRPLPLALILAKEFDGLAWIRREWGAGACQAPGRSLAPHLVNSIVAHSQKAKRRKVYAHTGWRKIAGVWGYLHGAGAIGGGDPVDVALGDNLQLYRLPAPGGLEAAQASLRFLDIGPWEITAPLIACAYLAPFADLCKIDFSLWLYGVTGA